MADRAQRPFWFHQTIEYIMGLALIALGFQDPEPLLLLVAGVVVMLNAALTAGPLGAFRLVGRRGHRWLDVVVMILLVAAAVQPWVPISPIGRVVLIGICIPFGFVWWYTSWEPRSARSGADGGTAERWGRAAGRLTRRGIDTAKERIDPS